MEKLHQTVKVYCFLIGVRVGTYTVKLLRIYLLNAMTMAASRRQRRNKLYIITISSDIKMNVISFMGKLVQPSLGFM